jgi:hypothetical protein
MWRGEGRADERMLLHNDEYHGSFCSILFVEEGVDKA